MFASDRAALSSSSTAVHPVRNERPRETEDPLLEAVGHTPLLPLRRIAAGSAFELWAKAEFLNPSGSVKDRAALGIVRHALESGLLSEGKVLLDASSGNTAVAYAMLGARLGFPVELCVPRNANPDRVAKMLAFGARLIFTDPAEGSDGAQREARRLAAEDPVHRYYPDQYNNRANPDAHYASTGPEIWRAARGRITHLVAGVGTGGTISGTGRYLKEQDPRIRVVGVEPTGPLHGIEGLKHLPTALRPSTYDAEVVDETVRVETEEADRFRRRLAELEGVSAGISSGAAVAASIEVGRRAPGSVVVTILPDGGHVLPEDGP